MIEYIKGEIVELTPTRMILECGGIGYELNISLNTYSAFGNKTTGKIYIYEVIREDAHLLFGFAENRKGVVPFAYFRFRRGTEYRTHDPFFSTAIRIGSSDRFEE